MEKQKSTLPSLPLLLIITLMQTASMILPGFILKKENSTIAPSVMILFIGYLFVSEVFQAVARISYRQEKKINSNLYIGKLLIASLLIYFFAQKTTVFYGIILFAYEAFQLLQILNSYHYIDSFFYTVLNPFFKGWVFNILIFTTLPFQFSVSIVQPFIFPFLLFLASTTFSQGSYSNKMQQKRFLFLFSLATIASQVYSFFLYSQKALTVNTWIINLILALLTTYFVSFKAKSGTKKEFFLAFGILLQILIFYLV